jgi:GT2 family glycosyltransferase
MFEDDDYSQRARQLGLRVVCARDAFIHHWMKAAFSRLPAAEYEALFERNRRVYEAKWGAWTPHDGSPALVAELRTWRPALAEPAPQRWPRA